MILNNYDDFIELNEGKFEWTLIAFMLFNAIGGDTPGYKLKEVEHVKDRVLCHEIGHALGLTHSEDVESCLYQCVGKTTSEDWNDCMSGVLPGEKDIELLFDRHNHDLVTVEYPIEHLHCK